MKKCVLLGVLLVMLFNMGGWYPLYKTFRKKLRQEARAYISNHVPDQEMEIFTLKSLEELNWVEKHEFVVNHQMYDVIAIDTLKEVFVVKAFKDTKETNLIASFFKYQGDKSQKKNTFYLLFKYYKNSSFNDFYLNNHLTLIQFDVPVMYVSNYMNSPIEGPQPPPPQLLTV